jgi:hypothetical protein
MRGVSGDDPDDGAGVASGAAAETAGSGGSVSRSPGATPGRAQCARRIRRQRRRCKAGPRQKPPCGAPRGARTDRKVRAAPRERGCRAVRARRFSRVRRVGAPRPLTCGAAAKGNQTAALTLRGNERCCSTGHRRRPRKSGPWRRGVRQRDTGRPQRGDAAAVTPPGRSSRWSGAIPCRHGRAPRRAADSCG